MAKPFFFHSEQVHAVVKNGHHKTRRNIVTVKGNKGTKKIEVLDTKHGKKVKKNSKSLTKKEIKNIRKGVFMPKLFRDL